MAVSPCWVADGRECCLAARRHRRRDNHVVAPEGPRHRLAIVPSMALIGMGIATGNADLALGAAARWALDALCVLIGGGSIFVHRRGDRERPA
jgi:hypothetical protein